MHNEFKKTHLIVYISLFVIFAFLILFNSFYYLRASLSDQLYGGKQALDKIVIVTIDDNSINQIGHWPWDRDIFAQLLKKTKDAKVIGLDVSFFEPSSNDALLEKTINSQDNLVLASEINQGIVYKPIFNATTGYVNLLTDSDGVTRSFRTDLSDEIMPFSLAILEKYLPNSQPKYQNKNYINFISRPGTFIQIKAKDVLNNSFSFAFNDKIVLIGATAPNLHDNYFVPTSDGIAMSGVEIHANIIQNLILKNFLQNQGKLSILFLTLIFSSFAFFFLSKMKIFYLVPISLCFLILFILFGVLMFTKADYVLDLFFVPLSFLISLGAGMGTNYLEERKHSEYLTSAFGRYISKDLLGEIINKKHQLKLGGAKREITVFFSDIRGFTSISEKLSPEDLVHLINEYLTKMTKIILEFKGTVDKFIGDAIMAFWNAPLLQPNHPLLACQSAIAQIKALRKLQESLEARGLPKIDIGCGLHTGEAIIGNMGSEDRFDYTVMGDTVNLASRLESLTKQYGVQIIISESTYNNIKDNLACRKLDRVKVKGKKIPITIYELLVEEDTKFVLQYEKALNLYFNSKFKEARQAFEKADKIKTDISSQLFIKRCLEYMKNPPSKGWDGSFEMKTK